MKCLIDMDGVVANFVKGCCALYGKEQEDWPKGAYNFPFEMFGEASEGAVWERIANLGSDFWRDLDLLPDAEEIVAYCEEFFGATNCAFLTSPPKSSPLAATGKIQWVKKHFPDYNRRILVGACKEFCAHQNSVLIDDYSVNIVKFIDHGGKGVMLPRSWNEEHHLNTIETLLTRLRKVTNGK